MYDQMELDTRNGYEQSVDYAIGEAQEKAFDYVNYLRDGSPVKNRHEGYGILAENFVELQKTQKKVQAGMSEFLKILPTDTRHAVEESSSILNAVHEVAVRATVMAAWANRVMKDLYDLQVLEEKTPLEDMYGSGDGFESADEAEPEAELLDEPDEDPQDEPEEEPQEESDNGCD